MKLVYWIRGLKGAFVGLFFLTSQSAVFGSAVEEKKLSVVVSILPQAFIVERIGGSHVSLEVLVKPGVSPATYAPTPSQIQTLSQADVYFHIGVPFENKFLPTIREMLPSLQIVDMRTNIELREASAEHHEHHDHHDCAAVDGKDPHIWLDPHLVKIQAATVSATLSEHLPEQRSVFEANLAQLESDLDALDREIKAILGHFQGRSFFVFHPAYGYFADAYGLEQRAFEVEGKAPTPKQMEDLIERARQNNIRALFVQPQFATANAQVIANEIGADLVFLDPLSKDYITNLREMAQRIAEGLDR